MRRPDDESAITAASDRFLEGFLGELARALKATAFYPRSHPALRASTARVHQTYERLQRSRPTDDAAPVLELGVGRRGFTESGRPVAAQVSGVTDLAHECTIRRVSRLFFRPEASVDDLGHFLQVLTLDPDDLAQDGGFEARLAEAGVRAIWANEADLLSILDRIAREERRKAGAQWSWDAKRADGQVAGTQGAPGGDEADDPEQMSSERRMLALLARLDREVDGVAYQETIERLRWPAVELRNTAPFETLLPALVVLGQHASGTGGRRGMAQRQMADALLSELVNEPLLAWLVARIGLREARGDRELIGRVLTRLGARALTTLLDALSAIEDRGARRALSQIITLFGEAAVPELELRMLDGRWFVVRNMAALLGEVRHRGSVPPLTELLAHEDGRVRRTALQALAKIGGPQASVQIVRCLTSGDPDLQVQAILAVGAWREATALPTLEAIARGGDAGGQGRRQRDPEVRRHAIESLGLIGGQRAVRVLADLLTTGGFWGRVFGRRESALIRIAAAEALAGVGGPEARRLLRAAAGKRGAVADRCRELAAMLG